MKVVTVTWPRGTDDAAEDVRANAQRVGHAVEKLRVVGIAATSRRPVFEDRNTERAPHPPGHPFGAFFSARKRRELEPLEVEGVSKGMLADARAPSAGDAAVVRAAMAEATWGAPVVLDGELGDQRLKAAQPRHEGVVNSSASAVADLVPTVMHEGVRVAVGATRSLGDAFHGVQLVLPRRPAREEAKEADILASRDLFEQESARIEYARRDICYYC